jgi:hypothetical protein
MSKFSKFSKQVLSASSALQAVALISAGMVMATAVATPAMAQDFTNVTATGKIVGADGQGISGATVVLTSNDQGFSNTVQSDGSGNYRIPALPQGSYTFEVSAPGFETFTDKTVELTQAAGGNNFQLVAAGSASSGDITVVGRRVRVSDFDRATTGSVISVSDLAERVPVARNLTSVVLLAPGTTQGDSAFGNLAGISGSSVSENAYFVNGLNITDFRQGLGSVEVPFVFYDTVEVKNGGIPAEFGRFTGGFVNAITKKGTNELHAGALITFQPNSLTSDRPNTLGAYNQQDVRQDISSVFHVSGPIIKDRLFFFGFYQTNYNKSEDTFLVNNANTVLVAGDLNPVTNTIVTASTALAPYSTGDFRRTDKTKTPYYGGKIDFIPFDGHRFEATYFNSTQETSRLTYAVNYANGDFTQSDGSVVNYGSLIDKGAPVIGGNSGSSGLIGGGENYVGRYTGQFTDWLTISGAYGVNKRIVNTTSSRPDYPFITDEAGLGAVGNSVNLLRKNLDKREFYRADAEVFVNLLGEHHFKVGYDRENLTSDSLNSYTGGVAWTYTNSGTGDTNTPLPNVNYAAGRTFINGGIFTSKNEAFYAQDSWSLFDKRLTINLGVRNDRFSNQNVEGKTYYKSGSQWAPRLSFTADAFGDGTTKVYGSFGRYYLPVASNTNIRLAGAETDYTRYFLLTGVNPDGTPILGAPLLTAADATTCPASGTVANCVLISDGVATPTEATVAKNLKPQSADEFIVGVERNLGGRMRIGLYGTYRKLNESLEDVAIDAAVNKYCTAGNLNCTEINPANGLPRPIWRGFHQYVLVNPGSASRITLSDPINGETTLRTIDFSADDLGYPKAKRTYKSVTATFARDFDGTWGVDASYTWSKNEGNIEGGIRSDNGQTDSGLTTAFDQPGLVNGSFGYLPGDARHNFKVNGSFRPFSWLTLGANLQASSPRRFGCIGRVPRTVDAFAGAYGAAGFYCNTDAQGNVITDPTFAFINDSATRVGGQRPSTLKLTPRGSLLQSDWNIVNNFSAVFDLPNDLLGASFRVDVFNAFNRQGKLELNELGTQDSGSPRGDYGAVTTYQSPRFVRFQLAFDF